MKNYYRGLNNDAGLKKRHILCIRFEIKAYKGSQLCPAFEFTTSGGNGFQKFISFIKKIEKLFL